jgi:hypothetical protein
MAINVSDVLAALVGAGQGVTLIDERRRRQRLDDEARADRDQQRRAEQAAKTFEFRTNLRNAGYRSADDVAAELTGQTDRAMQQLADAGPMTTPSGIPAADSRIKALIEPPQLRTRPQMSAPLTTATGRRETLTDPSGASGDYIFDPTQTKETRDAIAKSKAKDADDAREETQLRRVAQSLVDNGVMGRDGKPMTFDQAFGMVYAHKFAPELVKPATPDNIDPLSKAGIAASAERAGAVAKAEAPFKPPPKDPNALPPAQANQVKAQQTALLNLQRSLDAVREYVSQHGIELLGGGRAALGTLLADAQIQYKEAANLGALTGPDLGMIDKALGNPTSWTQWMHGGKNGALKALEGAQASLQRRATTLENVYGLPMPKEFRRTAGPAPSGSGAPAGAGGDTGNITLSDPEAWLKRRRGGG